LEMINKMQENRLNRELNKQAFENSINQLGELSWTQINKVYNNITEEDLK